MVSDAVLVLQDLSSVCLSTGSVLPLSVCSQQNPEKSKTQKAPKRKPLLSPTIKVHLPRTMASTSFAAARSVIRSTAARAVTTSRLAAGTKPKPTQSPFRIPKQNSISHRIFRSPVEMSFCVESMLPYHTATASALLTSMLSVSRRTHGWTPEDG
ncbi:Protein NUCLEAR FUSION DEFECTIVE 6 chloroplastic/mitochondrial isoform X2 [Quillaja saponaria]|uniref:Protein NUCLEAR FUSION DEFECTIVE 6 chloroplastic/mitochondrial isoform X2 n=1 Tax=Quillaja saponaria TaxID=32244 RepID=A0AAD7M274_QUISA|nr:Protein NUCLEAR FUSION DEFECTIVE 6 chloroplastic/mitochondrial isoform X2 [Quillaja saponaria]